MIEKIKSMPWGVMVSAVFLLVIYGGMCVIVPMIGLGLFVGIGTILAIMRVAHYLQFGN